MLSTTAAQREHARVRAHLEGALREVTAGRAPASQAARSRRRTVLERLRDYIDAGAYPINDVSRDPTPIFIDRRGNRCAVAALLEATGEHALVNRIADAENLARVAQLARHGALRSWLRQYGLSVDDAARIQPAYHAHTEVDWTPTVSVIAAAHLGGRESVGVEGTLLGGVRAGIRRETSGNDDRGSSEYGSLAFTLEYAAIAERAAYHQLGLTLQWEPIGNSDDYQFYAFGGPLASLDPNDDPGGGFGGQLGVCFSFRRRSFPLLVELVGQSLAQGGFFTGRAGLQLGVVW